MINQGSANGTCGYYSKWKSCCIELCATHKSTIVCCMSDLNCVSCFQLRLYWSCLSERLSFDSGVGWVKQDHQRWGYITVTQMEQSVYLAIRKDKNTKKRQNQRNGEDGFLFFAASLRTFGAQVGRIQNVFFTLFCLFVNLRERCKKTRKKTNTC